LINIGEGKFILFEKMFGSSERIFIGIIWKLERGNSVLDVDVEYVVVLLPLI